MYGKHFSSMYEGSMVGAGAHVFAVWGYCISNADPDVHTVRLNPSLLAVILGEPVARIKDAIAYLCSPDAESCCTDADGRRLVNTSGMEYLLVTHEHYREIKTAGDRREYMRKYMRGYRKAHKDNDLDDTVNTCKDVSLQTFTPVSVSGSESGSGGGSKGDGYTEEFETFWDVYPKKKAKATAYRAWKKSKTRPHIDELCAIVKRHAASKDWLKDGGQFIPNPATWLNGGCWHDVVDPEIKATGTRRNVTDLT